MKMNFAVLVLGVAMLVWGVAHLASPRKHPRPLCRGAASSIGPVTLVNAGTAKAHVTWFPKGCKP